MCEAKTFKELMDAVFDLCEEKIEVNRTINIVGDLIVIATFDNRTNAISMDAIGIRNARIVFVHSNALHIFKRFDGAFHTPHH